MTLPIFKSHFSIGKSILTLNEPKDSSGDSSDSVFDIAEQNNLDKVVLVEDSFMGFLQARKVCSILSKQLIFGIRLDCCEDINKLDDKSESKCNHKIILFPKNKMFSLEHLMYPRVGWVGKKKTNNQQKLAGEW